MTRRTHRPKPAPTMTPSLRIYRRAVQCRARDLTQLTILGELARRISELTHALQKERGTSCIFLGSRGEHFAEALEQRVSESQRHQAAVYGLLAHIDEKLDQTSAGARFYARVALALRELDSITLMREKIAGLTLTPQDAVDEFTAIIASLLAVGFEAADVAADPDTSRALVALVNFAQGKEYAGQERAIAGAAFSRGEFSLAERHRLRQLQTAQTQTFDLFIEFAAREHVDALAALEQNAAVAGIDHMRLVAAGAGQEGTTAVTADAWYELTTERIDGMKAVEDHLAAALAQLCAVKLAEGESSEEMVRLSETLQATPTVALFLRENDSGDGEPKAGVGLSSLRSMLDVVKEQARRIDDINTQLRSARIELSERKIIERAKGILTRSRRLSEDEAYRLMRQTAMKQNKRMVEVAEAIISAVDILRGQGS